MIYKIKSYKKPKQRINEFILIGVILKQCTLL